MKNVLINGVVKRVPNHQTKSTDHFVPKKYTPKGTGGRPQVDETGKPLLLPTVGRRLSEIKTNGFLGGYHE